MEIRSRSGNESQHQLKHPLFSVIIPVRVKTDYLAETIDKLHLQSFQNFELIVVDDKLSGNLPPPQKRNFGAKISRGQYLAFLDDDSYPSPDWLTSAAKLLDNDQLAAVCGPCLTPPDDNIYQQASGLVWESYLGSGGAGFYRNRISKSRFVDDYPSVNLIVRKSDFTKIKGFDTHHWPGEDTLLCLNLTQNLNKKILYHPSLVVYHHRRSVIIPHLQQITRYALHRGLFARLYPKTSFRPGYLAPSLFCLYLPFSPIFPYPLYLYLLLLLTTFIQLAAKNRPLTSLLAVITIPVTHLYYGILFLVGFFRKSLSFQPHQVNEKGYIGG